MCDTITCGIPIEMCILGLIISYFAIGYIVYRILDAFKLIKDIIDAVLVVVFYPILIACAIAAGLIFCAGYAIYMLLLGLFFLAIEILFPALAWLGLYIYDFFTAGPRVRKLEARADKIENKMVVKTPETKKSVRTVKKLSKHKSKSKRKR